MRERAPLERGGESFSFYSRLNGSRARWRRGVLQERRRESPPRESLCCETIAGLSSTIGHSCEARTRREGLQPERLRSKKPRSKRLSQRTVESCGSKLLAAWKPLQ